MYEKVYIKGKGMWRTIKFGCINPITNGGEAAKTGTSFFYCPEV